MICLSLRSSYVVEFGFGVRGFDIRFGVCFIIDMVMVIVSKLYIVC